MPERNRLITKPAPPVKPPVGWTVARTVHTTLDEGVDVIVRAGQDQAIPTCLTEAVWALRCAAALTSGTPASSCSCDDARSRPADELADRPEQVVQLDRLAELLGAALRGAVQVA